MCTLGFPTTVSSCTADNCATKEVDNISTIRIIPGMLFACSGTVTHWRAAGEFCAGINANINPVLSVWRRRSSSKPEIYNRVGGIELGRCGREVQAPLVMGMSNVYECTLPQNERVSVQPRYIVGIELSEINNASFRLYFDGDDGSQNYVFSQENLRTIDFNQNGGRTDSAQPQILLTVEITPTTQPLVTTSSTTEIANNGPSTKNSLSTGLSNNASNPQDIGISIAIVGGIVTLAVLLAFIIVLLLILILRSQKSGQKLSPVPASDRGNIINPTYNRKQSNIVFTL